MIDNKTTNLKLPLPNLANYTKDDVPRLITALQMIDNLLATKALVNTKADAQQTASNINLKANTEDMINALALKALTGGSKSNAFLVGAATDPNHAARLLQLQQRVGSAGAPTGRNKIVDGRFDFWYEGTTQTTSGYGSDTMWSNLNNGSTKTHSQQSLTPGVDLPAIECPSAKFFSRTVVSSVAGADNFVDKWQFCEGVRTLAGKVATLSFYARSNAPRNMAVSFTQHFGSTGSADVSHPYGLIPLTTIWKRYILTTTIPSIAGKTISGINDWLGVCFLFDAGSNHNAIASNLGQQSGTFDIACVQLEEGSVATPFEELSPQVAQNLVNRYYQQIGKGNYGIGLQCYGAAGLVFGLTVPYLSRMRVAPSAAKVGTWGANNCAQPGIPIVGDASLFMNSTAIANGFTAFSSVDATTYITLDARL